jgi:hypothetical protein
MHDDVFWDSNYTKSAHVSHQKLDGRSSRHCCMLHSVIGWALWKSVMYNTNLQISGRNAERIKRESGQINHYEESKLLWKLSHVFLDCNNNNPSDTKTLLEILWISWEILQGNQGTKLLIICCIKQGVLLSVWLYSMLIKVSKQQLLSFTHFKWNSLHLFSDEVACLRSLVQCSVFS